MTNRKEYMKKYNKEYYIKNKEKLDEYKKQWEEENKDRSKKNRREYYQKNKEKRREYSRTYCKNNREKMRKYHKIYMREYRDIHKEELNKKRNEQIKARNRTDLKFNLNDRMGSTLRKSLKGNKNGWHWEDLVGYTLEDLIKQLKKTMPKGYTWQDLLEGRLHIDHKIPKSAFNYDSPKHSDFERCWALKNLQLLPAEENKVKGNKLTRPFQPALKI